MRDKTLKAKAQIRLEPGDITEHAPDLSGIRPRAPELIPGRFTAALGLSGAPLGVSCVHLGGVLDASSYVARKVSGISMPF